MNRPITSTEIEAMIKNFFPITKSPRSDCFKGTFYQMSGEELTLNLLKFFQKLQRDETSQTRSMRPPSP